MTNQKKLIGGGYNILIDSALQTNSELQISKPSANTPAIRFRGFTEPWKTYKICDIATMYSGGTPTTSKKEFYGGNIPFVRSGEIHNEKTELFITELGLKNSSAKLISKGDILMAIYGATSGEIDISQINGAINQAILCIHTTSYKYFFKYSWMRNVNRIIDLYLQGAQGNLSAQLVKEVDMLFPENTEQEKIGNFFREQDENIRYAQLQITKLRNIKQACMQKMFA